MRARLVGVGRQLDAAGLAAPAHLHLRLHDDRVADAVGDRDRLGHRGDGRAVGHGDAVAREELLALVFEEIHGGESWSIRRPHTNRGIERLGGTPWAVPIARSDAKLLLLAAGGVIVAGLLVAAVLLLATSRRVEPDQVPTVRAGVATVDQART